MAKRSPNGDGQSALDALFWRDEILQVMFWMRGEGLSETPSAEELTAFLNTDAVMLHAHLDRMVKEKYLTSAHGNRYTLTENGRAEGGKLFMDEFAGLTKQAHGECNNPNCACKTQGPQACEARTTHAHH